MDDKNLDIYNISPTLLTRHFQNIHVYACRHLISEIIQLIRFVLTQAVMLVGSFATLSELWKMYIRILMQLDNLVLTHSLLNNNSLRNPYSRFVLTTIISCNNTIILNNRAWFHTKCARLNNDRFIKVNTSISKTKCKLKKTKYYSRKKKQKRDYCNKKSHTQKAKK